MVKKGGRGLLVVKKYVGKGVAGGTELRKEGCCWWYSSMVGRALLWYSSMEVKGVAGGTEAW